VIHESDAATSHAAEVAADAFLRHAGRSLLLGMYAAIRSLKLYPVENATVQKALDDLETSARALLAVESDLELRLAGDFIFVNATRLRLELDNYASFSHILTMLRAFEVGVMRVHRSVNRREWQAFLSILLSLAERPVAEPAVVHVRVAGALSHMSLSSRPASGPVNCRKRSAGTALASAW